MGNTKTSLQSSELTNYNNDTCKASESLEAHTWLAAQDGID